MPARENRAQHVLAVAAVLEAGLRQAGRGRRMPFKVASGIVFTVKGRGKLP